MSYLTANEQWALHAAYHPSKDDMSDAEALAAYHAMEKDHPDRIAAEAAGARFAAATGQAQDEARKKEQEQAAGVIPKRRIAKNRSLQVWALVSPEIDIEKLARLIVDMAMRDDLGLFGDRKPPDTNQQVTQDSSKRRTKDSSGLIAASSRKAPPRAKAPAARLPRPMPSTIRTKIDETWKCLEAKSYLTAILVARSAVADILTTPSDKASQSG